MKDFLDLYKKTNSLHHAYFFVGDVSVINTELLDFFNKKLKFQTASNPDFKKLNFENFTIDEAREIRQFSESRNISGDKMVFLVSFESISHEAQNSLLKVLEEPAADTFFFFISPQDNLLPTLKSRMQIYKDEPKEAKDTEDILRLNFKQRIERIKEITESISDEEETKQSAIDFVNVVEREFYKNGVKNNYRALTMCSNAREALLQRGAPIKMILENLVLSI